MWLNLTLRTPVSNARTNAAIEYAVLTCPVTPTEVLNVFPMSIRRRAARTAIGLEAKLATTNDGRNNFRREPSEKLGLLSITRDYARLLFVHHPWMHVVGFEVPLSLHDATKTVSSILW